MKQEILDILFFFYKNIDTAYIVCYIFHIDKRYGYTVRFPTSLFYFGEKELATMVRQVLFFGNRTEQSKDRTMRSLL